MIFRADLIEESDEGNVYAPADVFPVLASRTKFSWLRALPAIRFGDAKSDDSGIDERKGQITGRNLAHRLIEGIASPVSIALRRPKVATRNLLARCLILIDPPVSQPWLHASR